MIDKRKFYINGAWVDPIIKKDFDVINPSNEESYATISLGSIMDVNLAVSAAKTAFSKWSQVEKKEKIYLRSKREKYYLLNLMQMVLYL